MSTRMITYPWGVKGWPTRIIEAGEGDDVVVLVHGLGARADRWLHNIEALAATGRRVIAFDLPGHGFAGKGPDFDYGTPGYADFLLALLDSLDLPTVHLIGTSLGGHVVSAASIRAPERVRSLVLVGSVGLLPLNEETLLAIRTRIADASPTGVEGKLRNLVVDQSRITPEWVREESLINMSPGAADSFERLGNYFAERLNHDLVLDGLLELGGDIPLLLVWGAQERTIPVAIAYEAHQALPASALVLIDSAAHAPYLEQPAKFNHVVAGFIDKNVVAGS